MIPFLSWSAYDWCSKTD